MSDYESFEPIDSQVDLSSFDDEFETADAPSYDEVPDGKYQVKIQTAKLESSQKGDPMIKFDLVVISGSQAGRHHRMNLWLSKRRHHYPTSSGRGFHQIIRITCRQVITTPTICPKAIQVTTTLACHHIQWSLLDA